MAPKKKGASGAKSLENYLSRYLGLYNSSARTALYFSKGIWKNHCVPHKYVV